MSLCSSPKRRGPPLNCQITFGGQAPPSNLMQAPIGHRSEPPAAERSWGLSVTRMFLAQRIVPFSTYIK